MTQYLPQRNGDEPFFIQDLIKAHLDGQTTNKTLQQFLQDPQYGISDQIKGWIDEETNSKTPSEEEVLLDESVNLIKQLDDNIKYDIMEFIPTFSKWKQFESEKELLKEMKLPKEIIRTNEFYRDSDLVTFHKMRVISKSFNRRMMIRLLNINEVFINLKLPNVKEVMQGFNRLFAEQSKYVQMNRKLPDSTLYLYSDSTIPDPYREEVKNVKKYSSLFDDGDGFDGSDDDYASTIPSRFRANNPKNFFLDDDNLFGNKPKGNDIFAIKSKDSKITPFQRAPQLHSTPKEVINVYDNLEYSKSSTNRMSFSRETFHFTQPNSTINHITILGETITNLDCFSNLKTLTLIQSSMTNIAAQMNSLEKVYLIENGDRFFDKVKYFSYLPIVEMIKRLSVKKCVGVNGLLNIMTARTNDFESLFGTVSILEKVLTNADKRILDYLFVELKIPIELIEPKSKQVAFQYLLYLSNKVSFN